MDPESRFKIINTHSPLISSPSMSSAYPDKPNKGSFSVEDSGPPSPTSGLVTNFAQVAPGIYRSSFPMSGNFAHLRSLGLKTILTLVPEEYPSDNVTFMQENGIQHFQIPIPAHKSPAVKIPLQNIANALDILQNPMMHPVLIHCNKGKHRTGCVVACYRMIADGWGTDAVITEYRKYSAPKNRTLDEAFIYNFDVPGMTSLLKSAGAGMLPTPPASDRDCDGGVEDDAWTLHVGI
ncbi:MAG: hypothetical protein LQ350_008512 [Teloschistes chrysophthalmus]|nr:MAG: hypothetical protein LQ350_008512 [Niorma chrysophthalma]